MILAWFVIVLSMALACYSSCCVCFCLLFPLSDLRFLRLFHGIVYGVGLFFIVWAMVWASFLAVLSMVLALFSLLCLVLSLLSMVLASFLFFRLGFPLFCLWFCVCLCDTVHV